jgi:hypothetical protein
VHEALEDLAVVGRESVNKLKAFDPAILAAMRRLETSLDAMSQSAPIVHQIN